MAEHSITRTSTSSHRDEQGRRHCAGCGEPSGKPSEGGKSLGGLRNRRGKDQPMYCMDCHPERMGGFGKAGLSALIGLDN